MPKISICTPVHKMNYELSEKFLVELLSSLLYQTFKDFEVVISDQSDTDELKNICKVFSKVLNVKYIKNIRGLNTTADNVNMAISNATGEIVKILFVDDFFVEQTGLQEIWDAFQANPDKMWLIAGYVNCSEDKEFFLYRNLAKFDNPVPNGQNMTGNPSTYAVRREYALEMDENLLFVVDEEYFERSYWYYGPPIIIDKVIHCFRVHKDSVYWNKKFHHLEEEERLYVEEKFKKLT